MSGAPRGSQGSGHGRVADDAGEDRRLLEGLRQRCAEQRARIVALEASNAARQEMLEEAATTRGRLEAAIDRIEELTITQAHLATTGKQTDITTTQASLEATLDRVAELATMRARLEATLKRLEHLGLVVAPDGSIHPRLRTFVPRILLARASSVRRRMSLGKPVRSK